MFNLAGGGVYKLPGVATKPFTRNWPSESTVRITPKSSLQNMNHLLAKFLKWSSISRMYLSIGNPSRSSSLCSHFAHSNFTLIWIFYGMQKGFRIVDCIFNRRSILSFVLRTSISMGKKNLLRLGLNPLTGLGKLNSMQKAIVKKRNETPFAEQHTDVIPLDANLPYLLAQPHRQITQRIEESKWESTLRHPGRCLSPFEYSSSSACAKKKKSSLICIIFTMCDRDRKRTNPYRSHPFYLPDLVGTTRASCSRVGKIEEDAG